MAALDEDALFSGPEPEEGGGKKADMLARGREGPGMRAVASILLAVALLVARPAGARNALDFEYEQTIARLEKEAAAIPPEENAATYYRKAFRVLPEREEGGRLISHPPKTDEEKVEYFIRRVLYRSLPDAVNEMPGAKEEIRKYGEAVTVHLRRGAAMKRCSFNLDWRAGPAMLMPHLAKARSLARRAVCYGKLLEYEKKPREAARVYADVVRMGAHFQRDPSMISVACGGGYVAIARPAVEGLLARGVDAETARMLLEGLRDMPAPTSFAARAIDTERVCCGGWLRKALRKEFALGREDLLKQLEATDRAWDTLGLPDVDLGPHKPWQVAETAEENVRLILEALETYDGHMKLLSRAMRGPYHLSRPRVERIARAQEVYWKGERREGRLAGALVGNLVGGGSYFHRNLARTEAGLGGLALLVAASLVKAGTGTYPADLAALATHFPKGLPLDPFTGGNFSYWLADGLPAAACKADDLERKKTHPDTYHFGLSYRLYLENWEVEKWRAARGEATRKEGAAE